MINTQLFNQIMDGIDKAIYESLSDDKIKISNHKFTTEEIIKIC